MKCPYCNHPDTRVIDSRPVEDDSCIRRIIRACYKRPVPAEEIQKTVERIEIKIFSLEEKEIPSHIIGEIVMEELQSLDAVAYVRFASIYREFKDVNTFMDEIKKILDR